MNNSEIKEIALKQSAEDIGKFEFYHCFETPNMHWLNDRLLERGHKVCFMAEYYLPEWSNALCKDRSHLDMLGIGAYDNGRLIGFAACSADCDEMWQIGIDVLPEYRQKGIASALTSKLAKEILNRGKVPFYCSAWSNIRSARNAAKSGFIPAWVEMTVKPADVVDEMNS